MLMRYDFWRAGWHLKPSSPAQIAALDEALYRWPPIHSGIESLWRWMARHSTALLTSYALVVLEAV
jgi:hypothetical protein